MLSSRPLTKRPRAAIACNRCRQAKAKVVTSFGFELPLKADHISVSATAKDLNAGGVRGRSRNAYTLMVVDGKS